MRARAGLWAGFITAVGTTAFLIAFGSMLPDGMDLRGMAFFVDRVNHPGLAQALGAVNHIAAGAGIGLVYGWLAPRFTLVTGMICLMLFWLVLMLAGFPLVGLGLFGWRDGISLMICTFIMFNIFGMVLAMLARWRLAGST
jgi:hypothetical protein